MCLRRGMKSVLQFEVSQGSGKSGDPSSTKSFRSTTGLNINSPCWILFSLERKTGGGERKVYIIHPVTQISVLLMHMNIHVRKHPKIMKKIVMLLLRRLQSSEQESRAGVWIKYRNVSKLFSLHCSLADYQQASKAAWMLYEAIDSLLFVDKSLPTT